MCVCIYIYIYIYMYIYIVIFQQPLFWNANAVLTCTVLPCSLRQRCQWPEGKTSPTLRPHLNGLQHLLQQLLQRCGLGIQWQDLCLRQLLDENGIPMDWDLSSGKHTKNYWKLPFIVSFSLFHSYVSLPEGIPNLLDRPLTVNHQGLNTQRSWSLL